MTKKIDQNLAKQLAQQATDSPRLRSNVNFHTEMDDPVQRLFISIRKGSYVRPHHHPADHKWEMIMATHGALGLVLFEADGTILEKIELVPGGEISGVEMPPNTWHTVYPMQQDAVFLELKQGPYTPAQATDFAEWAPMEGEAEAQEFLTWVERAQPGQRFCDR